MQPTNEGGWCLYNSALNGYMAAIDSPTGEMILTSYCDAFTTFLLEVNSVGPDYEYMYNIGMADWLAVPFETLAPLAVCSGN
jgi:hypothetical protein